jgi:hypothetical protein
MRGPLVRLAAFSLLLALGALGAVDRVAAQALDVPPPPPEPEPASERLLVPFRSGLLWGFARPNRTLAVACKYSYVDLEVLDTDDLVRVAVDRSAGGSGDDLAWGAVDASGAEVLPPIYDAVTIQRDRVVTFRSGRLYGAAVANGAVIAPLEPSVPTVARVSDVLWVTRRGEPGALFTTAGTPISLPLAADETFDCDDGVVRFLAPSGPSGFGLIEPEAARVVRLRGYLECYGLHSGLAVVAAIDPATGKRAYGFVDADGAEKIPPRYPNADILGFGADKSGLARVGRGGRIGLIDATGKVVVPPRYDYVGPFSNGFAVVGRGRQFGLVDLTGHETISPTFESLGFWVATHEINEGTIGPSPVLVAASGGRLGLVCADGTLRARFVYDEFPVEPYLSYAYYRSLGLVWAKRGGHYALLGADGTELIPPVYDQVRLDHEMWENVGFPVAIGGRWGLVDRAGRERVPPQFEALIGEGLPDAIVVKNGGRYGLIDGEGRTRLRTEYDGIAVFANGVVRVARGGRYGFFRATGEPLTDLVYEDAGPFAGGVAPVERGGRWTLVSETGSEVIAPSYDRIDYAGTVENEARFRARRGTACGYLDSGGREVIPLRYEAYGGRGDSDTWAFTSGRACVSRGGRFGFVDARGVEIVAPKYDRPAAFLHGFGAYALVSAGGLPGFVDRDGVEFFDGTGDEPGRARRRGSV